MLNERRARVLRALVEEYIASATPVGSRTLVDRYDLRCSPATVRNELAILEESGYVVQPHVSAGRMPTDSGYRSFVDELSTEGGAPLDAAQVVDIAARHASELDELLRETSAALTRLTNCLAVVLAPSISLSRVRRVDLLSVGTRRAVFVLITESGQVLNRTLELGEVAAPERIADVERALNAALAGKRASEIRPLRDALGEHVTDALVTDVIDAILDGLDEADRDRLHHIGVPALLSQPEFHDADRVRPLIELLEDDLAALEAFSDSLGTPEMTVRIGHENRRAELENVSVVVTTYGSGDRDGFVGVIGPTRMDYQRAMAAVRAVASELSDAVS
jgi:heat-inducible transcriptional repressor